MIKKLFKGVLPDNQTMRAAIIKRNILREFAKMGGEVFGPIPEGTRREFFNLDQHTWVWHEEWIDEYGKHNVRMTRYDVRPHGIFKAQDGQPYQPISIEEANRLCNAAREYQRRFHEKVDPILATAGV
ncbi:hypothetical protein KDA14_02450 [Candidatus Saccharibacteria bacterium]|nr:hypothetical protein [Candidatus Saccharibacteria bacterium]